MCRVFISHVKLWLVITRTVLHFYGLDAIKKVKKNKEICFAKTYIKL